MASASLGVAFVDGGNGFSEQQEDSAGIGVSDDLVHPTGNIRPDIQYDAFSGDAHVAVNIDEIDPDSIALPELHRLSSPVNSIDPPSAAHSISPSATNRLTACPARRSPTPQSFASSASLSEFGRV